MRIPLIEHDYIPYGGKQRGPEDIELGVIHAMRARFLVDGQTMGPTALLRKVKRSAHGFVRRKGDLIHSVPWTKTAWHAKGVNNKSVGLEVLVYDDAAGLTYSEFLKLIGINPNDRTPIPGAKSPYYSEQYPAVGYWMACVETWLGRPLKWIGHFQCSTVKDDPGPLFDFDKAHEYRKLWLMRHLDPSPFLQ